MKIDSYMVVEEVQLMLDEYGEFEVELWDIIEDDPDLTPEEKEWAHDNLGVALCVTVLSPQKPEDE
jgi:hypothetical protein